MLELVICMGSLDSHSTYGGHKRPSLSSLLVTLFQVTGAVTCVLKSSMVGKSQLEWFRLP